jgi:hypothetical protein
MDALPARPWFVAVLVFESSVRESWSDPSVDVQYRLFRADDAEAAYERALALGGEHELEYENVYGDTCVWSFKGLQDLQEIIEDEIFDGIEVYGFIEDGTAEDRVLPKEDLTVFRPGRPVEDI